VGTLREVLSRTIDPDAPLLGQEFYYLRLFEEDNPLGPRHCVLQVHAVCNDVSRGPLWESEEVEYFWILAEAKKRYVERKLALNGMGFIYSDMDPVL
jgi:hypothetical protein